MSSAFIFKLNVVIPLERMARASTGKTYAQARRNMQNKDMMGWLCRVLLLVLCTRVQQRCLGPTTDTLALESALVTHFAFDASDHGLVNESLHPGNLQKQKMSAVCYLLCLHVSAKGGTKSKRGNRGKKIAH